ncbi:MULTISPECIES: inositol monophosphatase [Citricoccus]|uniref:Myo-inositol-1(Or 4)-monophosphatase n=1 Tax=Citricoccus muralis TaxID=169134 RepID=A0A3D9LHN3_9MICC|nr:MULTISPECIES: inositol monophosphatase [Citricoccus]REE05186.1 myo-inositol-1(or 4)-monophosphatase [Citricoccus muralis]VXB00069.1 Myo-inositol-1(Or 4)-monophosphatase [Citricoccus sp. K5]
MSSALPAPSELRRIAITAAAACAPRLVRAFRSTPADLNLTIKRSSHDLVTVHDRATEDELVRLLGEAVPGSRFIGEEGGARGYDPRPAGSGQAAGLPADAHRLEWIIDPIDGTANFAHGFAMFSISIAAAVDGEVVAGVVLDPVNGLEFSADEVGAYLNGVRFGAETASVDAAHLVDAVHLADPPAEPAMNLVTSYPSAEALELDGPVALERFGRLVDSYATVRRTVSGALELAFTAIGWADVTLGVDTNPWDVGVGQLLVRRAGGHYLALFYDTDGPERRPAHLAPCYVAVAPGRVAPTAVRVLEETVAVRRTAGYRR